METIPHTRFRVAPISSELATRIRRTLRDDFGNHLVVVEHQSPAPCRQCLSLSQPGEHLIVFAYRPFSTPGLYAEIGPVFIHARECTPYVVRGVFPPDFRQRVLTMRGYNERGTIETAELSAPGEPEASLERLFSDDNVKFVHVRNPAWGCFDFQVDREA